MTLISYSMNDGEGFTADEFCNFRVTPYQEEGEPIGEWLNDAAIHFDDEKNCVTFTFSVSDPRGGFEVNVYRVPDDAESENAGKIILTTPYEGMSGPHAPIRQIMPGSYVIEP